MFLGSHEDSHVAMYKCAFGAEDAKKKAREDFNGIGAKFLNRLE